MKSDYQSEVWVTFPAAPFQIGFIYPFPVFPQSFFTLIGLCYIQAMPMLWRVLYTLEHIIENKGIDIGLSKLSHMYNLVNHESHRFLFKHKPQKTHPLLKVTKNDTHWRNQFFFVRRDSIPNGISLPKKWNTQAISLSHKQDSPVTAERVSAFWNLDPAIRTFPPRIKDSQEISSTSYTMSISPRSIKKELDASQSMPERKGMSTRAKDGSKRKKPSESSEGLHLIEQQLHEAVSEKFTEIQILQGQHLADAEERILNLQTIAAAKDKRIAHLEKESKTLQKQILLADITANKER
ncbi:hypothetical protein Hanom_Chr12g01090911 [Helianthus anomalus]